MQTLLILLTAGAALTLILLVSLLPRESQRFFQDSSSIGKSGYWDTDLVMKLSVLLASLALFALLIYFMIQAL
ncbi:accessory Sec system protein Asp5 [Streptococcus panodentis]|uniref:Accessory secretory protein Asp5 n=1 Tax=Streptococcus panodentis TaxID=1581472 RepID=A0ABS5AX68_9STRE|nr:MULTISPECIES: accessory secretory protein Asp5 [Streptococcus]KXT79296.1 hypothetical protein STRDD11_02319 [Streptococcus sp. DD11]MBP2621166.1 accessory secretory protein Asp5 [Streptococcus panodentis]